MTVARSDLVIILKVNEEIEINSGAKETCANLAASRRQHQKPYSITSTHLQLSLGLPHKWFGINTLGPHIPDLNLIILAL